MNYLRYIIDNFDQGLRRMTRITEDTVVLSSEVSDIDAEELSDTASDKSSNISDLEFQSFSSQKIVKEKITEIEEGIYCL